jgi:hypothetical protein
MWSTEHARNRAGLVALAACVAAVGCSRRHDMYDQPRYEVYEASSLFADGRASREFPAGTVARGGLRADDFYYKGMEDTAFARHFPMPVTREVLRRGQERYAIFCTPCHDPGGHGRGMVVRRGFKQPPSFHIERLRGSAPGYFFDVVTNGFGQMSGYAAQIPVADRWAIAAYLRALQLSQYATLADLPHDERTRAEQAIHEAGHPQAPAEHGADPHGAGARQPESGGH